MRRNPGRRRYRKDDPLRDLHVPRSERLDEDPADGSDDARDPLTGEVTTDALDREAIRRRGEVVSERDLRD